MINKSFLDKINALKQPDIVVFPTEGSLPIAKETLHGITFHPISLSEIYALIQDLPATGSTGIDAISSKMLKFAACELVPIIAKLLNISIFLSSFPTRWKTVVVTPIYKKEQKAEISNYRPISILPLISKIFKRLLDRQLRDFLENKCALSLVQHGFCKSRSCQTALIFLSSSLFCNRQNKRHSIVAALDYSKAFDTLDYQLLLHKLGTLGISGRTLTWFKSYLTQRRQCVKYNNVLSYYESIKYSVPQGSVLGPTLYVIYVNDLLTSLPANAVIAYADYVTLTANEFTGEEASFNLQMLFNTVHSWSTENALYLNISKMFHNAYIAISSFICASKH